MTYRMAAIDPVLDYLRCGEEDEVTGARCSLLVPHDLPHLDESDWGVILSFKESHLPKLIIPGVDPEMVVPDLGTE